MSWEQEYGVALNPSKCKLRILNATEAEEEAISILFRDILPGIKVVKASELCLLGTPLTDEAIPPMFKDKTEAVERLATRLNLLQPHQAFFLLNCLSISKMMYFLRTYPVWKQPQVLSLSDEVMRITLQAISNTALERTRWLRATMPVRCGGLGIRLAEELAISAYLSSINSVKGLIAEIYPAFNLEQSTKLAVDWWTGASFCDPPSEPKRSIQKEWDTAIVLGQYEDAFNLVKDNIVTKAQFLAAAAAHAGHWLNTLPSPIFGNLLDGDALRISIALRLGANVCIEHFCICGKEVDRLSHHGLSCKNSAGRHSRHTAINDLIYRALISSGTPSRREPVGITRGDSRHPDGVTMCPYSNGYSMIWDFTCVDTPAPSYVVNSANNPGSAATQLEERKRAKYADLAGNYIFYPVAIDTFGPLGPSAEKLWSDIGKRLIEKTGDVRQAEFLQQRVSIEMQRGNTTSVLGTIPFSRGLQGVFSVLINPKK